jgi:hypothetical protein
MDPTRLLEFPKEFQMRANNRILSILMLRLLSKFEHSTIMRGALQFIKKAIWAQPEGKNSVFNYYSLKDFLARAS